MVILTVLGLEITIMQGKLLGPIDLTKIHAQNTYTKVGHAGSIYEVAWAVWKHLAMYLLVLTWQYIFF